MGGRVAVLNLSSASDNDVGRIAQMLRAYDRMVSRPWWLAYAEVEFMPGVKVAPDGWVPAIAADHPDVASALGYHDVDAKGRPYMRSFLDAVPNGTVLHDPEGAGESLAGVMAHEFAEWKLDDAANLWAQGRAVDPATGKVYSLLARELCDPVQGFSFPVLLPDGSRVDASDFVLPDYFNPPRIVDPGAVDYMRRLADPFTVAPGGYLIVAKVGSDGQVFGMEKLRHASVPPAAWRDALKAHPAGRTARRQASLAVAA